MWSPAIEAHDSHPRDPKPPIQRLLVVADAAVAEVDGLPPWARAVIDGPFEREVLVLESCGSQG